MLSQEQCLSYQENGFLILRNFISQDTCDQLRTRIEELAQSSYVTEEMSIFRTETERHLKDRYFLESGDKIRFFLEEDSRFFNKCGHALHTLDPVFSEFCHSKKNTRHIPRSRLARSFAYTVYVYFQTRRSGRTGRLASGCNVSLHGTKLSCRFVVCSRRCESGKRLPVGYSWCTQRAFEKPFSENAGDRTRL